MKRDRVAAPRTVSEYLAEVPSDKRSALQDLRKVIRSVAPDAEEVMSYGMPAFRQKRMLVYYAAFENHCSLFIGAAARSRFAAALKPYAGGKGTVQFTPEHPLPASLVRRIVKARMAEIEGSASAKPARRKRQA